MKGLYVATYSLTLHHRRPTRVVRLVRNLSRVADHGLAPYHSVNNGRIHKSPQIDLLSAKPCCMSLQ